MAEILGWHFIRSDRRLAYSGEPLELGRVYRFEPPIVPCKRGLHGSIRLIDALPHAPGPILTRCRFGGQIVHETDKLAAETREVLWVGDVTNLLWLASCNFAETACRTAKWTNPRSLAAIEARRGWVAGTVTDQGLSAARSAAVSAAGSAAWSAARSAARSAAWSAAGPAAWSAAWSERNDWLECAVRDMAGEEGR